MCWTGLRATTETPLNAPPRWDLIVANLFLHHFEGEQLARLVPAIAKKSDRLLACEPRRDWLALVGSHLTGMIGANAVTREDAVLSVHAGFSGERAQCAVARSGRRPGESQERAAGPFSHCFCAERFGELSLMKIEFDAVIIGAGLAGSSAAIMLARAGWSVALVEKQSYPRRKVCGECIAASNLPLLRGPGDRCRVRACAGPELRKVALMHGDAHGGGRPAAAPHEHYPWGRALGREMLDTLLLAQARDGWGACDATLVCMRINGPAGDWRCDVRATDTGALLTLRAAVLDRCPWLLGSTALCARPPRRVHRASDLLAFKANFRGARQSEDLLPVLSFNGGYGGMVGGRRRHDHHGLLHPPRPSRSLPRANPRACVPAR